MFCLDCGTQIPYDSNFCLKCGKPQKQNVHTEEVKWETCEIVWEDFRGGTFDSAKGCFSANAIGPNGVYSASKSPTYKLGGFSFTASDYFPNQYKPEHIAAYNDFVAQLVKDGWEPTGAKGTRWFNDKFRRRVK